MKALIVNAKQWGSIPICPSQKIGSAVPDQCPPKETLAREECLVAFFQIEAHDTAEHVHKFCGDIKRISLEFQTSRLVIECFCHLSKSRPDPVMAKQLVQQVFETCSKFEGCSSTTSPFGWDKELLLHVKGHPGSFRHRSY